MKVFGIVGTFFQEGQRPAVIHRSETEGGTAVALLHEAYSYAFSGHFWLDEDIGCGEGMMFDEYGPSRIRVVKPSDSKLHFSKEYERTGNTLMYRFELQEDGTWAGTYENDLVGSGVSRCRLVELEPELFELGTMTKG